MKAELEAKGHKLTMHNGYSDVFGGGQAVMRDYATGVNYGASDPRKDGAAIPELTIKIGRKVGQASSLSLFVIIAWPETDREILKKFQSKPRQAEARPTRAPRLSPLRGRRCARTSATSPSRAG